MPGPKRRVSVLLVFSLAVVGAALGSAIFASLLSPHDPFEQFQDGLSQLGEPRAPSATYVFGTDILGRDLLSRILYGARASLFIGIVANGIAVLVGTIIGLLAGWFRGWRGSALMRFTDLVMSFPSLILAITLAALLKPSLWIVALVIALVNWVQVARVIYAETLSLTSRDYIQAEVCLGSGGARILLRHVVPYLLPTMIVWATLGISTSVMYEATLSFLGVGVQPPTPSWGNIIFENQTYFQSAPWLVLIPGLFIILVAVAFNILGDHLRTLFDPAQKER